MLSKPNIHSDKKDERGNGAEAELDVVATVSGGNGERAGH
jgi:hypothetical protein